MVRGPVKNTIPVCLSCYNELDPENVVVCWICNFPFCSEECQQFEEHQQECSIFAKQNVVSRQTSSFAYDLKWFSQHQSVLKRALDILRCPKLTQSVIRVSWGPVVASQGQSGSIKTALSQYEYELVCLESTFCFANISAP